MNKILNFIQHIFTSKYDAVFPIDYVEESIDKKYVYSLRDGLIPCINGTGEYSSWNDLILKKGWEIFVPLKTTADILWKYDKIKYFKYQINSIKYRLKRYKNKYK